MRFESKVKLAKNFIVFTFLLAFAGCVLEQAQTSKIVWKNVQAKVTVAQLFQSAVVSV